MSGPLAVLGNPSSFAHNEHGVFNGPLTFGMQAPLPGNAPIGPGGPGFNASRVRGATGANYYNDTTTYGISTHHLSQDVSEWKSGDTTARTYVIGERLTSGLGLNSRHCSYPMRSVMEWNRKMQYDSQWRIKYGNELNCEKIRRDFFFLGFQLNQQIQLEQMNNYNEEICIQTSGVMHNVPNIWLASSNHGKSVSEGCTLYWVFRRYRFHGDDIAFSPDLWQPYTTESTISTDFNRMSITPEPMTQVRNSAGSKPTFQLANNKLGLTSENIEANNEVGVYKYNDKEFRVETNPDPTNVSFDSSEYSNDIRKGETLNMKLDDLDTSKTNGRYYWRMDPYVSYDRRPPQPCLYMGDPLHDPDNQFFGDKKHVGQIIHCTRGRNNATTDQVCRARESLYPQVRGTEYRNPLFLLDTVSIDIGCAAGSVI